MARTQASRKYQLTLNNPEKHDWSHEYIKNALGTFSSMVYWCMCDEIGEEGTPHTHLFVVFKNAVEFAALQKPFYGAHLEPSKGSNQENRDYIRKEGKWAEDKKKETNLSNTFEEYGELPPDRAEGAKETTAIVQMVKEGASNYEILEAYPNAMSKLEKIDRTRQTYQEEKYKNIFRKLDVTYLWGAAGVGKTRSVMEEYGYDKVYKVTNYIHPFDEYKGQDVMLFDEFRSSLLISELLHYLDGYPMVLPCRYSNKQACYTKVYILSNIPLEQQYRNIQAEQKETWEALLRRINHNYEMLPDAKDGDGWLKE
ncbi:MAG: replication protein [Oscillospiraceae bacterium]|nr:replication protein [Oscillospiraceae bacterium]